MKRIRKFFYINTKIGADPDSTWKLQNEKTKTDPIYKLVDLSGGGSLIDVYDKGGTRESYEEKKKRVWEFAKQYIKPEYLHDEIHDIEDKEYREWNNNVSKELKRFHQEKEESGTKSRIAQLRREPTGSLASLDSVLSSYHDKRCIWKLEKRGAVGETPFHLLFINNTPKHLAIARMLLELYPSLAVDEYMGFDYYGESPLHLAIIQNDIDLVKRLLNTGFCNVQGRAQGRFFMPLDVKRGNITMLKSNYDGFAYFGEYPLSFAASIGNFDMYDVLLESNADVEAKDQLGNTALHLTVIHNKMDMFHHAINHAIHPANPSITNASGLTPLALAGFLGRKDMFKAILDLAAKRFWSFSYMVCSAYPLKDLDSISYTGDTNWESGLMQIIQGDTDDHLDMLQGGVVTSLLDKKWQVFARTKFLRLFVYHIIHILCLSCAVYLRPNDITTLITGTDASSIARYVFEILTVLGCIMALFYACREVWIETFKGFWQNIKSIPSRLLYDFGCILVILCIPMRIAKLVNVEDWFLVFAIPFLWSYFLFFARGFRLTGPFVTMIYNMIKTDLLRFGVIYIIIWGTSAIVFFYQFKDLNVTAFQTELGTFMTLLQMSLGEFSYSDIRSGRYPPLAVILFIVYMMLVHVLLLNMLIAMMTRTYESIAKQTKKEWRRQWASIVIIMERSYSNVDKLYFQDLYSTQMHARRVTSAGGVGEHLIESETLEDIKDRGLLWIHDKGLSSGKKKTAITDMWKKTTKNANKLSPTNEDQEVKLVHPRRMSASSQTGKIKKGPLASAHLQD